MVNSRSERLAGTSVNKLKLTLDEIILSSDDELLAALEAAGIEGSRSYDVREAALYKKYRLDKGANLSYYVGVEQMHIVAVFRSEKEVSILAGKQLRDGAEVYLAMDWLGDHWQEAKPLFDMIGGEPIMIGSIIGGGFSAKTANKLVLDGLSYEIKGATITSQSSYGEHARYKGKTAEIVANLTFSGFVVELESVEGEPPAVTLSKIIGQTTQALALAIEKMEDKEDKVKVSNNSW